MSPKRIIDFNSWAEDFTEMLVEESRKLMKVKGDKHMRSLEIIFIGKLVSHMVLESLERKLPGESTKKQAYDHAYKNFRDAKHGVQMAVATAFEAAMSKFSGRGVEYDCSITPVPEPLNRKPC